jgi:hypothetical protein
MGPDLDPAGQLIRYRYHRTDHRISLRNIAIFKSAVLRVIVIGESASNFYMWIRHI